MIIKIRDIKFAGLTLFFTLQEFMQERYTKLTFQLITVHALLAWSKNSSFIT